MVPPLGRDSSVGLMHDVVTPLDQVLNVGQKVLNDIGLYSYGFQEPADLPRVVEASS